MNSLINLINVNIDVATFMYKKLKSDLENLKFGSYVLMIKVNTDNYDKVKEELNSIILNYENEIKMYGSIKKIILEYFARV